jgi:hypothetical protein
LIAYQRAPSLTASVWGQILRWFVHVLARLAITATCTSSAAAFDAQVEHGKYPSSANSLWEHLMLNSSESVNGVARQYNVPGRELRVDWCDDSSAARENLVQAARAKAPRLGLAEVNSPPPVTRADHRNTALWSSILTLFTEGFALYGASYGGSLHAIAMSSVEPCPAEASAPQPKEISSRERRKSIYLISPLARLDLSGLGVTAPDREGDADRIAFGSGLRSATGSLAGRPGSASLDADRSNHRNWRTKAWAAIASRWARWDREREIKKGCGCLGGIR